jgi:hypothetical protein
LVYFLVRASLDRPLSPPLIPLRRCIFPRSVLDIIPAVVTVLELDDLVDFEHLNS